MRTLLSLCLTLPPLLLCSCAPTLSAYRLDGEGRRAHWLPARAIPYYLPKPYLLVAKNFVMIEAEAPARTRDKGKTDDNDGEPAKPKKANGAKTEPSSQSEARAMAPRATRVPPEAGKAHYSYRILYLPDLSKQYGLKLTRGIGSSELKIALDQGWMFTGADFKADAQLDETISALASLVAETGKLASPLMGALLEVEKEVVEVKEQDAGLYLFDLTNGACVAAWPGGCGAQAGLGSGISK